MDNLYLGYSAAELSASPYARFFNLHMGKLPEDVCEAVFTGPVAWELMPVIQCAPDLLNEGYWPIENGYSIGPDASARLAVLTHMPGVTPAMWDWWFAWHGSEAQRYKLWHPGAHVHVGWADGRSDLRHYVGRVSNVVEYIGSERLRLKIGFVAPASIGLDERKLAGRGEVAICARAAIAGLPLETGWLIHHVRPVVGGSEMRSRFWLGGENLRINGVHRTLGKPLERIAATLNRQKMAAQAPDLLVHCAQEMNHLAAILPELYATFEND